MAGLTFVFGQFRPKISQIFFRSKLCFGLVNLKPVVPGHVLVIPQRHVIRFNDLLQEEIADLFLSVQLINTKLQGHYKATSSTIAIQDGPEAGMTVEHVHVHIMPRRHGDFEKNDEIYKQIERDRQARSDGEMAEEAKELAKLFPEHN